MRASVFFLILFSLTSISHADSSLPKVEDLIRECERSTPKVCMKIGGQYHSGNGVPQSMETAALFFKKGCERGAGAGCTYYGFTKFEAEGVRKFRGLGKNKQKYAKALSLAYSKARAYYTKGCDMGHGYGCMLYGVHYELAFGVVRNYDVARTYYKRGCLLEHASACSTLARMYERGVGVTANTEKAREYYGKSCKYGMKSFCGKYE